MNFARLLGFTMFLLLAMAFAMLFLFRRFFLAVFQIMPVIGITQVLLRITIPQKGGNKPNEQ